MPLLIGLILGAAVGVITSFAQADLPGTWASLANAASPWLVTPFVIGARTAGRTKAIAAGLLTCAMQVVAYYLTTALRGFAVADNEIAFWIACALVGGPAFGWAGWARRHGTMRVRVVGAAMLPATFLGEAVGAYAIRLHYRGDAALFAAIGLLLLAGLIGSNGRRRGPWVLVGWTVPLSAAATVLYGPLLQASSSFAFGA